jgi:hypothetical protein
MPNELPNPEEVWRGRLNAFVEDFKKEYKIVEKKRGEDLFRLILSSIKEIYGIDAVIAGGAVRDVLVQADALHKDVDVFIPLTWHDFNKYHEELGWGEIRSLTPVKKAYTSNPVQSNGRASARVQGVAVDLVFLDKPLDEAGVTAFPVHAQRCVWDLKSGTVVSPEARQDINNKTFTISPTITDPKAMETVFEKVGHWLQRPLYEGWTMVEPDTKEWKAFKKERAKAPVKKVKVKDFPVIGIAGEMLVRGDEWRFPHPLEGDRNDPQPE